MTGWRMPAMCDNCPFARKGKGRALARSLRPGRMAEIKRGLLRGETFDCHKTVEHDDDGEQVHTGRERVCAGALEWQNARGVSSTYQRVCERLEAAKGDK